MLWFNFCEVFFTIVREIELIFLVLSLFRIYLLYITFNFCFFFVSCNLWL